MSYEKAPEIVEAIKWVIENYNPKAEIPDKSTCFSKIKTKMIMRYNYLQMKPRQALSSTREHPEKNKAIRNQN
jgi:hypothetical protein